MLRKLYDRLTLLADKPGAIWILAAVSFAESSFFPIPPDIMLIPMVLANRQRAWLFAGVCTIASVLGGFLGYAIGYFLFETAGKRVIDFYHLQHAFENFQQQFQEWGMWVILIKGLTPIPYKIVTIASGAAHFNLLTFGIASAITRGGRFFLVSGLLYVVGEPVREFVEKRLTLVTTAFVLIIVGGFVALAYF
jgi:membrane protein YqaA with SNARE-associated domain